MRSTRQNVDAFGVQGSLRLRSGQAAAVASLCRAKGFTVHGGRSRAIPSVHGLGEDDCTAPFDLTQGRENKKSWPLPSRRRHLPKAQETPAVAEAMA